MYTSGFLVACERALHLGISWKVDTRVTRERRRESGGLENFNMAFDSNYHFFRFTIPPTPLESPVPRPGPYFFQNASVQNHLPHYNPEQVHKLFQYHSSLIRLPIQGARHKPHSLNRTPSPSQINGENNHKKTRSQYIQAPRQLWLWPAFAILIHWVSGLDCLLNFTVKTALELMNVQPVNRPRQNTVDNSDYER